jgi:hypothetical protein
MGMRNNTRYDKKDIMSCLATIAGETQFEGSGGERTAGVRLPCYHEFR